MTEITPQRTRAQIIEALRNKLEKPDDPDQITQAKKPAASKDDLKLADDVTKQVAEALSKG